MKNLKEESFCDDNCSFDNHLQCEADEICYSILSESNLTCEVTSGASKYSDSVVIPCKVLINGKTYKVTRIGDLAFSRCHGLTSVTIPDSVTSIGNSAFEVCSGLSSVTIPDGVIRIEDKAFFNCSGLTTVKIGKNVLSIGKYTFVKCPSLKKLIIGNSSKRLVFYVADRNRLPFFNCSLQYLYIGRDLQFKIENTNYAGPFFENISINELILGDGVTTIWDSAFCGCRGLTAVTIGKNVTKIERRAFEDCKGLNSVTIPDSVTTIGENAFYKCSGLTSLSIGKNVTKIEDKAFYCCDDLIEVNSLNPVPPRIRRETFSNYDNAILNVPKGSLNDYKDISYWKNFCRIQEKDFGGVETASNDVAKVFANGTRITIVGADKDAVVEVFDENGKRVTRGGGNEFEVEKNGIYTVHIESKTSD